MACDRFPVGKAGRCKRVGGFQAAGDLVELGLPKGKYAGKWHGRLAAVGSAGNGKGCLKVPKGVAPNGQLWASMKHFKLKQRADGYGYAH